MYRSSAMHTHNNAKRKKKKKRRRKKPKNKQTKTNRYSIFFVFGIQLGLTGSVSGSSNSAVSIFIVMNICVMFAGWKRPFGACALLFPGTKSMDAFRNLRHRRKVQPPWPSTRSQYQNLDLRPEHFRDDLDLLRRQHKQTDLDLYGVGNLAGSHGYSLQLFKQEAAFRDLPLYVRRFWQHGFRLGAEQHGGSGARAGRVEQVERQRVSGV